MSKTLVVTRKKDKAQIRVIKQFEDKGLILWDVLPQNGRKALSIDALELTSARLFWVRHATERTTATSACTSASKTSAGRRCPSASTAESYTSGLPSRSTASDAFTARCALSSIPKP